MLGRVQINSSKVYQEKYPQNFTSFSFAQMHTIVGPEGQKMLEFCILYSIDCWKMHFPMKIKVSSESHVTIRLKIAKCFSNEKNLIQIIAITWSKP